MRRDQLNRRIHQTSLAAKTERHLSPHIIQRGRAIRQSGGGGGASIAYCKTDSPDSPDSDEMTCYLGIAVEEWSGAKTYSLNQWCEVSGTEYKSLQDDNTNHAVTDGDWWEEGTISVTVKTLIINGSSLMYAAPFLRDGDPLLVGYVNIAGVRTLVCINIEFNGAFFG